VFIHLGDSYFPAKIPLLVEKETRWRRPTMFTGLIQQIGQLTTITPAGGTAVRLTIAAPGIATGLAIGESVAVDQVIVEFE
jgi:hypothetical protein